MVRNNKLEKLFTKISKYRKANTIPWKKVKSTIIEGLYQYIYTDAANTSEIYQYLWNGSAKSLIRLMKT